MTPPLPAALLARPIAHRGLWGPGVPENSPAAIRAAREAGYGVEIDVQMSADGRAVVFHDDLLGRLTSEAGTVRARSFADLTAIPLRGGGTIPSLDAALEAAGDAPLLLEIKDQDGALGPDIGLLEAAVAEALHGRAAPVAVMSFNPHSIAEMARLAPALPRGRVTGAFAAHEWPHVPEERREALRCLSPDGLSFVSHDARDLASPHLNALRGRLPILAWTIRSEAQAEEARRHAAQITFEGYAPAA